LARTCKEKGLSKSAVAKLANIDQRIVDIEDKIGPRLG
jgi:hypothetical protein